MTTQEFYTCIDGDYDSALERLMSDRILGNFILKFLDDKSYNQLMEALSKKDLDAAFKASHTLKGVTANLSFTALYNVVFELTEQLRSMDKMPDSNILESVDKEYIRVIDALHEYGN